MHRIRIVYKPDGTVAVIHPAPKSRNPEETEDQWVERVCLKVMKKGGMVDLEYDDTDSSKLPSREYRDAWRGEKGEGVYVDESAIDD